MVGAAFGLPVIAYIAVAVGFGWGMFLVPLVAAMLIFLLRAPHRDVLALLGAGVCAVIAFVVVFLLFSVDAHEGAPIATAALGAWVVGWLAALVAGLVDAGRTAVLKGHVS